MKGPIYNYYVSCKYHSTYNSLVENIGYLVEKYIEKMKNVTPKETIKNITKELKNEN